MGDTWSFTKISLNWRKRTNTFCPFSSGPRNVRWNELLHCWWSAIGDSTLTAEAGKERRRYICAIIDVLSMECDGSPDISNWDQRVSHGWMRSIRNDDVSYALERIAWYRETYFSSSSYPAMLWAISSRLSLPLSPHHAFFSLHSSLSLSIQPT